MATSADYCHDREFSKLVQRQPDVDLVRLMLEFARDAYPSLDADACLDEIDRLASKAMPRVARKARTPLAVRLGIVASLLFSEEGFHGNDESFYDPKNSYLNEVLERRSGIPISLGIIYQAVAVRAGLPIYGVGTPGHFVLGCTEDGETLYVDAFHSGTILDRDACRNRIEAILGRSGYLTDADFRPATASEIGSRVLRNLKTAYVMMNDWRSAVPVQRRLCALFPELAEERRDLGLMCLRVGQPHEALRLLERFQQASTDQQAAEIDPYIRAARRLMAELN